MCSRERDVNCHDCAAPQNGVDGSAVIPTAAPEKTGEDPVLRDVEKRQENDGRGDLNSECGSEEVTSIVNSAPQGQEQDLKNPRIPCLWTGCTRTFQHKTDRVNHQLLHHCTQVKSSMAKQNMALSDLSPEINSLEKKFAPGQMMIHSDDNVKIITEHEDKPFALVGTKFVNKNAESPGAQESTNEKTKPKAASAKAKLIATGLVPRPKIDNSPAPYNTTARVILKSIYEEKATLKPRERMARRMRARMATEMAAMAEMARKYNYVER